MFEREDLHPQQELLRHAQLLAAAYNPPLVSPRGKNKFWVASDFLKADPWAPPKVKKPPPTAAQVAAQVAAVNAARRKN